MKNPHKDKSIILRSALRPISVATAWVAGSHILHFHGRFTCSFCGNFSLDVTYHLTVQ